MTLFIAFLLIYSQNLGFGWYMLATGIWFFHLAFRKD